MPVLSVTFDGIGHAFEAMA
jgi:hypothetical protein